jgi:dihydrofolate reductase
VWAISFGTSPGELYHHRHVFEEIDRPRRIRLTTTETRLDGSSFVTSMEFTFAAQGEATLMTLTHAGFPTEELRDEHTRGLPTAFARLERICMPKSVLYMSMSLDGFITGPDDGPDQGLGAGGERLHDWLGPWDDSPSGFDPPGRSGEVLDEAMSTGAVVVGRKTFDYAGHWNGDHHGVPIFVPTRGTPPAPQSDWVHYVTDGVESAMRQAKQAAGEKDVMVHGADLAQSLLQAGVLDELEIHLVPVLLGGGRRLFGAQQAELELVRVVEAPGVTHLRYRIKA